MENKYGLFGDTRGVEHDDRNMQHILEYINQLTHLNAICFLIKPNTEKLSFFFQACITELLDYLEPNARENITFCFDRESFRYLFALQQNIPLNDLDENEYEKVKSFH